MQAFQDIAEEEGTTIYGWLDKIPKTAMVVGIIDKLQENGFNITKIET